MAQVRNQKSLLQALIEQNKKEILRSRRLIAELNECIRENRTNVQFNNDVLNPKIIPLRPARKNGVNISAARKKSGR